MGECAGAFVERIQIGQYGSGYPLGYWGLAVEVLLQAMQYKFQTARLNRAGDAGVLGVRQARPSRVRVPFPTAGVVGQPPSNLDGIAMADPNILTRDILTCQSLSGGQVARFADR